jgi:formylmethanofuran dehydrogenase subunit B
MAPACRRAAAEAATLLARSRLPVIAGLRADVAGISAALRLAETIGAAVDHAAAGPLLREVAVLHDAGMVLVTPDEARRLADTLLVVGAAAQAGAAKRLDLGSVRTLVLEDAVGEGPADVSAALAALRAVVNARPIAWRSDRRRLDALASDLASARYGVAVWSRGDLDALTLEMLAGLLKDLNARTRWAGLPVGGDATAEGAALACGWATGLPLRLAFRNGVAAHDPWRFRAERLVASGEADAIVWLSAFGDPPPHWLAGATTVVIGDDAAMAGATGPCMRIGRPGIDHDAILYDHRTATLIEVAARSPSDLPDAAAALDLIAEGLPA